MYLPVFPVWLVAEEPLQFQFVVALDLDQTFRWPERNNLDAIAERRYAFRISQDRLHQPLFRARVLTAYHERCALCRFRHTELLDAAHIRPDSKGGQPTVVNGIAMCRIHHGAYDANLLGINRQLKIVIRPDLLLERDGPTLRTMQELNGVVIEKPSSRAAWPDLELVSERFEEFQQVC